MRRARHEPRQIFVHAGRVVIRARLRDTPLAGSIWSLLPFYGSANIQKPWLSLALPTGFDPGPLEEEPAVVSAGELAYRPATKQILIGQGMTPAPSADSVRLLEQAHVWAAALDDLGQLASLENGQSVALLEAAS